MRIAAIGDTHGRNYWEDLPVEIFDKVIFIGDYFDDYGETTGQSQIDNFERICKLKESNPDKVVLLTGNHDFHYFSFSGQQYSGFQMGASVAIERSLDAARSKGLIQMCFRHKNFLFSHAGISKTWASENEIDWSRPDESVNDIWKYKPTKFRFTPGRYMDNHGDEPCQTPIWIRPDSLMFDLPDNFIQVVGHTRTSAIDIKQGRNHNGIMQIDILSYARKFLVIEPDKIYAQNLL